MRLFTGLDLPPEVVNRLTALIDRLRPHARINWSPPANLHITTKFIGEWPAERLAELKGVLAGLGAREALSCRIHELGFFPNPRAPRVFWCGIDAPGLSELAADTDHATAALGIEPEKRAFSPHLTLARIKEPMPFDSLRQAISSLPSVDFGSFRAASFFLYQSQLRPTGSVYTKLAEFPLAK